MTDNQLIAIMIFVTAITLAPAFGNICAYLWVEWFE